MNRRTYWDSFVPLTMIWLQQRQYSPLYAHQHRYSCYWCRYRFRYSPVIANWISSMIFPMIFVFLPWDMPVAAVLVPIQSHHVCMLMNSMHLAHRIHSMVCWAMFATRMSNHRIQIYRAFFEMAMILAPLLLSINFFSLLLADAYRLLSLFDYNLWIFNWILLRFYSLLINWINFIGSIYSMSIGTMHIPINIPLN